MGRGRRETIESTAIPDVLILGASARAAAFSALRCGLRPRCVDSFADRDLAAACPVQRVDPAQGVGAFVAAAESLPPSPWFYTGGLENHPDVVERIARRHRLWGAGAEVLRAIRDPVRVVEVLNRAGTPAPEVRREARGLPRDGSWLVKPLASGGGRGIGPLTAAEIPDESSRYFQRRIPGPSFSALFIGRGGSARLVGITRQWIGGVPGSPFAYRGSIGPCRLAGPLTRSLRALGDRLTSAFGLVGWFGVDYVLHEGRPWPVEINPRYPASLEIHEVATGRALLAEHRAACEGVPAPIEALEEEPARSRVVARWIIYAPRRLVAPDPIARWAGMSEPDLIPTVADVPWPGTEFEAGDPVLTLLASGAGVGQCRANLLRLRRAWARRLELIEGRPGIAAASARRGAVTNVNAPVD
jgi:predicted ATP-grasp superfamily ATP-dependent carboligase